MIDRFRLVNDVIDWDKGLGSQCAHTKQWLRDKQIDHKLYIETHGEDMSEIRDWKWDGKST